MSNPPKYVLPLNVMDELLLLRVLTKIKLSGRCFFCIFRIIPLPYYWSSYYCNGGPSLALPTDRARGCFSLLAIVTQLSQTLKPPPLTPTLFSYFSLFILLLLVFFLFLLLLLITIIVISHFPLVLPPIFPFCSSFPSSPLPPLL